jgi:hypothetical protein
MPPRELPFPPMEAELVEELPAHGGWQYEPKWDVLFTGEPVVPPWAPSFSVATEAAGGGATAGRARLRRRNRSRSGLR